MYNISSQTCAVLCGVAFAVRRGVKSGDDTPRVMCKVRLPTTGHLSLIRGMGFTMVRSTRAAGAFLLLAVVLLLAGSGSWVRGAAPIYGTASHPTVRALPADAGDWPLYGHDVSRTSYNPAETVIGAGNLSQVAPRW